jgi:Kef-type K+ transport system membrane component KefB
MVLALLAQAWWALPLSASLASFAVLATAVALRCTKWSRKQASFLTGAYLVCGSSTAAINMSPLLSLGVSPPAWVGYIMPAMLLGSAWIYYQSLNDSDEAREGGPRQKSFIWTAMPCDRKSNP